MRMDGRVHAGGLALLACLCAAGGGHGSPVEVKVWDSSTQPLTRMVEITNGFGLRVLSEHNFLSHNNIAFSPYGLTGILVALYEGIDGESARQLQRTMQLPWNRNVLRIGFRDIHRTLKTYFIPEEGFLAGLALNNDNVTFTEGYRKILRFYGFELDNDQYPTSSPRVPTVSSSATEDPAAAAAPADPTVAAADPTVTTTMASTPAREETTLNPSAETIGDADLTSTTMGPSSAPNAETTATTILTTVEATIENIETTITTTTEQQTVTPTTTAETIISTIETTTAAAETETVATSTSAAPSAALTDETVMTNEVDVSSTPEMSNTAPVSSTESATEGTSTTTEMPEAQTETTLTTGTLEVTSTTPSLPSDTTPSEVGSTLETLQRKKKSADYKSMYTNPPYINDIYNAYRSYKAYGVLPTLSTERPREDDHTMFLADGHRNIQVTYMQYNSVLDHAFLPHLDAQALRLPLDSDRYYLLVVLPSRPGTDELRRLLARMARESDLSDVYNALRPRRVHALVPSFNVKGHISLTTDLQRMGMRHVFEPRQRDFTPMTNEPGVYVRSIQQAVSVIIRKYHPDDLTRGKYMTRLQSVSFLATYPFLYFVMDSTINVALMAGKMVDPLNTRIL